jgi:hypothetical protein
MNINQILLSIVFLLGLFSCDRNKDVSYDIPLENKQLVLYGIIGNNSFPELEIYQTQNVLDKSESVLIEDIENIEVYIMENGVVVDTFEYDSGAIIWKARNVIPNESEQYAIQVKYQDYNVSSFPISLPEKIIIDSLDYQVSVSSGSLNVNVFFSDDSEEEHYYYVTIEKINDGNIIEPSSPKFWLMTSSKEIGDIPKSIFLEEDLNFNEVDEILVKFYHLSPEFDLFYERVFGNGNNFGNQYSNQLPPWTNIVGGLGFVGSYQVDSMKIEL